MSCRPSDPLQRQVAELLVVRASGQWDADTRRYTLTLAQHTPPTPGQPDKAPQVIPIAVGLLATNSFLVFYAHFGRAYSLVALLAFLLLFLCLLLLLK